MDATSTPHAPATRLVETVCRIIATEGLDAVTVREVATAAGVSIGAVQHHFRAKDDMLEAAFRYVVDTTSARVAAIPLGADIRQNLSRILSELLPLDETRLQEARVYVAFASRAVTSERLAVIQRETLGGIVQQVAAALTAARALAKATARTEAELLLAVADGLMFDAVTRGEQPNPRRLRALLDAYLERSLVD